MNRRVAENVYNGTWSGKFSLPAQINNGICLMLKDSDLNSFLWEALEGASEGLLLVDSQGKIVRANKKIAELFDYPVDELIEASVDMLLPLDLRAAHASHRSSFMNAPRQRPMGLGMKLEGRRKDGSVFPIEVSLSPVEIKGHRLALCFVNDISRRLQIEEQNRLHQRQLLQADKMVSLGILVSGVAHEINNPAGFIMLNGKILKRVWDDVMPILERNFEKKGDFLLAGIPYTRANEKIEQIILGISEGATRIEKIVRNLKDYARQDEGDMTQEVCINKVVESAIQIVNNLIKKTTDHFEATYAEGIPQIVGNSQQLEQVLINLLTNACQAIEKPAQQISVETRFDAASNRISVIVSDQGCGISPENLRYVMDPFFTTKQDMGGTGLGLSISYNIVMNHHGTLSFDSAVGIGTTAMLTLPAGEVRTEGQT